MAFQKGNQLSKNGGRPKAQHTLLAEQMRAHIINRVNAELNPILDAQIGLAKGIQMMMVREWETDKKGNRHRTGKWVQVTDPQEVEDLLNGEQSGDEYYQIWTKTPETNAAKNMLDQAVGKAKESLDANITGNLSLVDIIRKAKEERKAKKK